MNRMTPQVRTRRTRPTRDPRRFRHAAAGLVLLVALGSWSRVVASEDLIAALTDTVATPITLSEAVTMAQENNLAIIQAEGSVRTAAAGARSAAAAFLPSVNVSVGATRRLAGSDPEDPGELGSSEGNWSMSSGIGADVTLFAGGQRIFGWQQARARAAGAVVESRAARYDAVRSVQEQFFDVLAARESAAAARAQLEQAEQQFRVSTARVRARVATRSDSLRAETQVRSARLALLEARYAETTAAAALTRLVGASRLVTASPQESLGVVPIAQSDAELLALAMEAPQVQAARLSLEAARAARRSAWAAYLPSVTAGWSRGGGGSSETFDLGAAGDGYSGSLRLSLSLPVFDQLGREEKTTEAAVSLANAEAALRDALLGARSELTRLRASYRLAEARVATQLATVEASTEDLRLQQQRYQLGESTLLDVLTSQTQLDSARLALIQARYDQRVARASLEALLGREL